MVGRMNSALRGLSPFFLQPGDHGLELGVLQQGLIAVFPAPAGLLVTAEGHRHIRDTVAIDPEDARLEASVVS